MRPRKTRMPEGKDLRRGHDVCVASTVCADGSTVPCFLEPSVRVRGPGGSVHHTCDLRTASAITRVPRLEKIVKERVQLEAPRSIFSEAYPQHRACRTRLPVEDPGASSLVILGWRWWMVRTWKWLLPDTGEKRNTQRKVCTCKMRDRGRLGLGGSKHTTFSCERRSLVSISRNALDS